MRYLCILRIQPPSPRPVVMWSFLSSVSGCFPSRCLRNRTVLAIPFRNTAFGINDPWLICLRQLNGLRFKGFKQLYVQPQRQTY